MLARLHLSDSLVQQALDGLRRVVDHFDRHIDVAVTLMLLAARLNVLIAIVMDMPVNADRLVALFDLPLVRRVVREANLVTLVAHRERLNERPPDSLKATSIRLAVMVAHDPKDLAIQRRSDLPKEALALGRVARKAYVAKVKHHVMRSNDGIPSLDHDRVVFDGTTTILDDIVVEPVRVANYVKRRLEHSRRPRSLPVSGVGWLHRVLAFGRDR